MGFWKVLGGIGLGVAAVVALPVAGPIGAVTAVGAAVGGAIGGAAGALASDSDREEGEKIGEARATAKYKVEVDSMVSKMKIFQDTLKSDKEHFEFLIAMYAVGLATANSDGEIADVEMQEINDFVAGASQSSFPPHIKGMITRLRNNPPTLQTAMSYVKKLKKVDISLFEDIVIMVIEADGKKVKEERAFLTAFRKETKLLKNVG